MADVTPERAVATDITSPSTADAIAILEEVGDANADQVAALDARRRELFNERRVVAREIRNATRKRQRLLEKAKGLSNAALMEIVAARAARTAQSKAKAKVAAKAKTIAVSVASIFPLC